MIIHAYSKTGVLKNSIYRLAIVVEDFPHGAISVGKDIFTRRTALSRVPLQVILFTLSICIPYFLTITVL